MARRYKIVKIVVSADGCHAKVYDENGNLRSGINVHDGDAAYVTRKIAEFWPGVPIRKERKPHPKAHARLKRLRSYILRKRGRP